MSKFDLTFCIIWVQSKVGSVVLFQKNISKLYCKRLVYWKEDWKGFIETGEQNEIDIVAVDWLGVEESGILFYNNNIFLKNKIYWSLKAFERNVNELNNLIFK